MLCATRIWRSHYVCLLQSTANNAVCRIGYSELAIAFFLLRLDFDLAGLNLRNCFRSRADIVNPPVSSHYTMPSVASPSTEQHEST